MTHAAFDDEHRLTTDKITKRIEGKVATEVALYQSIKYLALNTINCVYHVSVACSTGSYTSILSAFQSNVSGSSGGRGGSGGGGGSQAGNVKKRSRGEGRGEGRGGPIDYNMLPGSTHGLMDEGRIYGKEENENNNENENENGGRDESKREKNDLNSNNDDDEVTVALSPSSSPMHKRNGISSTIIPSSSSSSSIDVSENGKTTYFFLPNIPTAHTDIENLISSEIFFKAEGINVLCGETNLFASDGLMLHLKRLYLLF